MLTPTPNAVIITALYINREKRAARLIVFFQVVMAFIVSGWVLKHYNNEQLSVAVLLGGLISAINGAMLAWRMHRVSKQKSNGISVTAHQELKLMFFYAAERFITVAVMLLLSMAVLKLLPLGVLEGFVMGQITLLMTQFILSTIKYK